MRCLPSHRCLVAPVTALLILFTASCRESLPQPPRATLSAARDVEVGLVVSTLTPSIDDTVVVLARLTSGIEVRPAASFTARLSYDAARLTYDGEVARADAGMRVINGEIVGEVRVAGIATDGFRNGELVALRFLVKTAGSVGALRLTLDQLHATDGEDLARAVVRSPTIDAGVAR